MNTSHLLESAQKVWGPNILIKPDCDGFWVEVPSFEGKFHPDSIPVDAIMDSRITGRLKGNLNGHIPGSTLNKLLNQDLEVIKQTASLIEKAKQFGATLKYVAYRAPQNNSYYTGSGHVKSLAKKSGIYYRYEKATGYLSNWQTRYRAEDTNFGLTSIKASQLMICCAVAELFPLNEHGEAVEWVEDQRTIFLDNKELDIASRNILPEFGGIQIEYQGHQSHRENSETIARDHMKVAEAQAKGHFFMQIPRINHISPEKALIAVQGAIQCFSGGAKEPYLPYMNPCPSAEKVGNSYIEKLPERARKTTDNLLMYCKNKGHRLITDKLLFLSTDKIEYECGSCHTIKSTTVKAFIESNTDHCGSCKGKLIAAKNQRNRKNVLNVGLGKLWNQLPVNVQHQLIDNPLKDPLTCDLCKKGSWYGDSLEELIGKIKEYDGFLCYHCLNTGKMQFVEGKMLTDYTQHRDSIEHIMRTTGWGNPKYWYKYITSKESLTEKTATEIWLKLECDNGHEQFNSVSRWQRTVLTSKKRKKSESYCDICHPIKMGKGLADQEHLDRVRKFHPNAKFIEAPNSGATPVHCGESSRIGDFTVQHPQVQVDIRKLKTRCKTKEHGEYSICVCCSEENNWEMPGGPKSLASLNARLRIRAALVATLLKDTSIDVAGVSASDKMLSDEVSGNDELSFQCHNHTHPPKIGKHGNFFNPNKPGYCSICLKALGVKTFKELVR